MQVEINNKIYKVIKVSKKNKNTYIRIDDEKNIVVTTASYTSEKDIMNIINKNILKIEKMIDNKKEKDTSSVYLYGKKYDIVIISNHKNIEINKDKIYGPSIKKINEYILIETKKYFEVLLKQNYDMIKEIIPHPTLKIRNMKSRWGVCNRKDKSVTLNVRLMEYNEEVISYVIIHELCHFVHFDHSKNFWNLVGFYCPNYKIIKHELRG